MSPSNIIKDKGFTLIELLVVIAIIGLLASVVLASLNSAKERANMTKKAAELSEVKKALFSYYLDTDSVPPRKNGGSSWDSFGAAGDTTLVELVNGGYISSIPESPDINPYYYYDYGSYIIVATRMTPRKFGPWQNGGWRCYPGFPGMGTDYIWCDGFDK